MPWLKLDDQCMEHPKVAQLTDREFRLWVHSLVYTSRHHILGGVLNDRLVRGALMATEEEVATLLRVGLWDLAEGGIEIHDWNDYQPSEEKRAATKAKRSAAGKKGAAKRWGPGSKNSKVDGKTDGPAMANGCPVPVPVPVEDIEIADPKDVDGPLPAQQSLPSIPPKLDEKQQQTASMQKVYAHYRTHSPDSPKKPGAAQERTIRARLNEGQPVASMCEAMDGYFGNPWYVDRGRTTIEFMLRDDDHIQTGRKMAGKGKPPKPAAPTRPPDHEQLEALGTKLGLSVFGSRRCAELIEAFGGSDVAAQALRDATENGAKMLRSADVAALIEEARVT